SNQHVVVRWVAWAFFGMTFVATLYFGWHYLIDNIAGVAIGWAAVSLGAWATNHQGARRLVAEEQGLSEHEVGIDIEADDVASSPAMASEAAPARRA
ncbi:MAG: phosphatase PAP2 family protein, partial [Nesterenkonia sp.]|nr:phosphatase PAP2 family protein [Nesterenkonia sp.]